MNSISVSCFPYPRSPKKRLRPRSEYMYGIVHKRLHSVLATKSVVCRKWFTISTSPVPLETDTTNGDNVALFCELADTWSGTYLSGRVQGIVPSYR